MLKSLRRESSGKLDKVNSYTRPKVIEVKIYYLKYINLLVESADLLMMRQKKVPTRLLYKKMHILKRVILKITLYWTIRLLMIVGKGMWTSHSVYIGGYKKKNKRKRSVSCWNLTRKVSWPKFLLEFSSTETSRHPLSLVIIPKVIILF
jgi:hypothetical protein